MRGRACAYALLLPLLAACSRDFSMFGFDQTMKRNAASGSPDAGDAAMAGSAAAPAPGGGAPAPPRAGAGGGTPRDPAPGGHSAPTPDVPDRPADQLDPSDAGVAEDASTLEPRDAGRIVPRDAGNIVPRDAGSIEPRDAGNIEPRDAGSLEPRDAGSIEPRDAGSIDSSTLECAESWSELSPPERADNPTAACQACACPACASAIVDCLHHRSPVERALCRDVLSCALRQRCQEYDCYCSSRDCGYPDGSGDGPCAREIDAAAGGNRSRVTALRNANPANRNEPLVRAMQAIACILGERTDSDRPAVAGQCNAQCQ